VKPPPEIALQDSTDDFSPQGSPSPPPRPIFQRTPPQPLPVALQLTRKTQQNLLDLTTLGISDPPLPPSKDDSTMDWIPSQQPTTFSRGATYSHDPSLFAAGRGTLPPAPGTSFPSTRPAKEKPVNWFKSASSPTLANLEADDKPQRKDIQFREQRLFAPQVCPCYIHIEGRNRLVWNHCWDRL
jgi:hypothetical protein